MSKKRVEAYIPAALEFARKELVQNGGIESKYVAYIASMGVSVLQSGLLPTYYFYNSKGVNGKKDLPQIVAVIIGDDKADKVFRDKRNKEKILDAITALKLAVRSFEKLDNKESDDE